VLELLTKYLLQYKSVSIPNVGTFRVVQQPPQLSVADKIILPPSYSIELKKEEEVSAHQLHFLNGALNRKNEDLLQDLKFFGNKLQEKINGPGFEWEGLGIITRSTQSLPIEINGLEPIMAVRVIRQDARHKVLVGDQHFMSGSSTVDEISGTEVSKTNRSLLVIAGWILLLLSILFIIFHLYTGKFKVKAAGSKQTPMGCMFQTPVKSTTNLQL